MRKALFILGELDDRDLAWLAEAGTVRSLAAGERLIEAGREVDQLFFLTDGSLEVTGARGEALAKLEVGEVVGEMSFVEKRNPNASVTALTASRVLAVPRAAMLAQFASDSGMAARFYKALAIFLSDRLRTMADGADSELDENILDNLSLAGGRFLELIARLEGRI